MVKVALGLKARTGRAILVAVGGTAREPHFVDRIEMPLLPPGAFAPYHAAEELEPAAARAASVKRDVAAAHRLAESGIRKAMERIKAAGHEARACGVLVGPALPPWGVEEIIAVHVRMHQAEGVLFREVLEAGARACGFKPAILREKAALDEAAKALKTPRASLEARIAALGKEAGAPWGKDQKEAAAAALAALVSNP
jgi:hypothetical protein